MRPWTNKRATEAAAAAPRSPIASARARAGGGRDCRTESAKSEWIQASMDRGPVTLLRSLNTHHTISTARQHRGTSLLTSAPKQRVERHCEEERKRQKRTRGGGGVATDSGRRPGDGTALHIRADAAADSDCAMEQRPNQPEMDNAAERSFFSGRSNRGTHRGRGEMQANGAEARADATTRTAPSSTTDRLHSTT